MSTTPLSFDTPSLGNREYSHKSDATNPFMFVVEEAIFVKSEKCPYHVTFDLDLDLEHTVDAGPSVDRRV